MKRTKRLIISLLTLLCCNTGMWASSIPGALSGRFTINASGEKVLFSQGNLQYQASTDTWRFASNQWDFIGNNANNTSPTSSNESYMDLFCWGATGLNGVAPNTADSYLSGSSVLSGNNDWGTNIGAGWRTLTSDEWAYLFNTRASGSTVNGTSNARYAFATIRTDVNSGINGIILFPDGVNFAASEFTTLGTVNGVSSYATKCTSDQWTALEGKGCVFLPAAGSRLGSTVSYAGVHGCYWSSSPYASYEADKAYDVYFGNVLSLPRETRRFFGSSVRLVRSSLEKDGEGNYLLGSADDWKDFAAIVNSGTNPAANAKMTADIDLGDDQTTIGSGNTNAEYANVVFKGIFDGNGHTLTVNYNTSEGFYAPIRHISGATIKNLHVTGSIVSSGGRVGGIVCGVFGGSSIHSKIEKCRSSVILTSNCQVPKSDAESVGGIVGQVGFNSKLSLEDCIFDGEITGHVSNVIWSGLVGVLDGTVNTTRCLQAGSFNDLNNGTTANSATIVCRWQNAGSSIVTMDATYYIHSFKTVQGTQATDEQLSDGTITAALQASRAEEVWVQAPITNLPMLKLFATKAYTVPASGIGTFSAKAKFAVPDGLTAYYCQTYDAQNYTISMEKINGPVPANTGVLLKGTPNETYTLTGTNNEATTVTGNALVAVTEATHVAPIAGDYTNFMLKSGTFIRIAASDDDVKMPANKAYLQIQTNDLPVDSQSETRAIRLSWGGVTSIHNSQLIIHNYALPAKRIVKGKLIIEKNGQMFNANGQLIK